MTSYKLAGIALAALSAVSLSLAAGAQESAKPRFAAPKRIKAGDAYLGAGRLYPSPVVYDVDGDGKLDIVVGDLPGRVTVARGLADGAGVAYGPEKPLESDAGKPIKFHNW